MLVERGEHPACSAQEAALAGVAGEAVQADCCSPGLASQSGTATDTYHSQPGSHRPDLASPTPTSTRKNRAHHDELRMLVHQACLCITACLPRLHQQHRVQHHLLGDGIDVLLRRACRTGRAGRRGVNGRSSPSHKEQLQRAGC